MRPLCSLSLGLGLGLSLCLLLATALPAAAQAVDSDEVNTTLLEATSPFEDMVEYALDRNDTGIARSLEVADRDAEAVETALPPAAGARFAERLHALHRAASQKDYQAVAAGAVEAYRLLLDGLQPGTLPAPREVNLLDYAGFKLLVLAGAEPPDWSAMRATAGDAAGWWRALAPRVADSALRDAFSSTVAGLGEATRIEDLPMLRLAVELDLDLVDLLESHFAGGR